MAQSAYSLAVSQGRSGTGLQGAPGTPGGPTTDWRSYERGNERAGYGQTGFGPPWQPNYPRPVGGGGGPALPPVVVVTPNPGDFDNGMRWEPVTGQWLPPNFFSDLNPPPPEDYPRYYGGGGGGGLTLPGVSAGSTVPGVGTLPTTAITPRPPGTYQFLTLPESLAGYIPEMYRPRYGQVVSNFLTGLGYQGTGDIGRYGERTYRPPAENANPYYFAPELFNAIADPNLAPWVRYLFGEMGYTTRITQPTIPALAPPG